MELKSCPFCGDTPCLDREKIFCDCGAKIEIPLYAYGAGDYYGFPTYEEAKTLMIEAWNRRCDNG